MTVAHTEFRPVLVEDDGVERSSVSDCKFCSSQEPKIDSVPGAFALPSYGALVPGWVLVVPEGHALSVAELPTAERSVVEAFVRSTSALVESKFGPVVSFEHGSGGAGRDAGCGVDHAHVHIVPGTWDLRSIIARTPGMPTFDWRAVEPGWNAGDNLDYIFISDQTGQWVALSERVPSQVVRRAIARQIGASEWDWKTDLRPDLTEATLNACRTPTRTA